MIFGEVLAPQDRDAPCLNSNRLLSHPIDTGKLLGITTDSGTITGGGVDCSAGGVVGVVVVLGGVVGGVVGVVVVLGGVTVTG